MNTAAATKQREFDYSFDDFDRLRRLSMSHTGIVVPDDKMDMFYSRLSRRLRALGLSSFAQYYDLIRDGRSEEFDHFINSITTNLTAFFREAHHFEYLKQTLLPDLLAARRVSRRIRIWSAGCSSGEEAYSIAMVLCELVPESETWDIRILATDIDSSVLSRAERGVYEMQAIRGLDEERCRRWLLRGRGGNAGKVRVCDRVRRLVSFRRLNLTERWPMKGPFDIIFCRNVLIYFNNETKQQLVERFEDMLPQGGHLFVGHSEAIMQWTRRLQLIGKTIYVKEG